MQCSLWASPHEITVKWPWNYLHKTNCHTKEPGNVHRLIILLWNQDKFLQMLENSCHLLPTGIDHDHYGPVNWRKFTVMYYVSWTASSTFVVYNEPTRNKCYKRASAVLRLWFSVWWLFDRWKVCFVMGRLLFNVFERCGSKLRYVSQTFNLTWNIIKISRSE